MKIIRNVLIIFILIYLILMFSLNNISYATTFAKVNPKYTKSSASIKGFAQDIFGAIRNIAVISSVVLLAYCGMRIVFGSVDQKAEYKKSLMPIIIGSLVVLFATTIVSMVQKLA